MRAPPGTIAVARRLRRNLSPPEAMLRNRLRARMPGMPTFRRQPPIGPYVPDFYCANARLAVDPRTVIRGDGMSHDVEDRPQRDPRRDAWLEGHGVKVMRIAAHDALHLADDAADGVVRTALAMIEARDLRPLHHASRGPPPPLRG
jgi:very-short-patch-repair endonuclease